MRSTHLPWDCWFDRYLKRWAAHLHTPILSIDYTLSPESDDVDNPGAQYPVAVNECFFVYCWALQNAHLLGSTAKRVVLVGDSAGANLALAVALKAAAVRLTSTFSLVTHSLIKI